MAGNRLIEHGMAASTPHTFAAFQDLVMALADARRAQGRRTIFGRDKGAPALARAEAQICRTFDAMARDGLVTWQQPAGEWLERLATSTRMFQQAFPNWDDAYALLPAVAVAALPEYLRSSRAFHGSSLPDTPGFER